MNTPPIVTALSKNIRLGNRALLSSLFTASDPDGDPITKIQIFDSNAALNSGFFEFNGAALAANVWHEFNISDLGLLRFAAASTILSDSFSIRVFDGMDWSTISSANVYSVRANITLPVGTFSDITVVAYEKVKVANYVNAFDSDGYPITQYQFRDLTTGSNSGFFQLNGVGLAQGTWVTVAASDLNNLYYVGALVAEIATLEMRAFDGGLWSPVDSASARTLANANRPVVQYAQYLKEAGTESFVQSLFTWSDEDGNTAKQFSFFDVDTSASSGYFKLNGMTLPSGQWFDVSPTDLANLKWVSASVNQAETFNVRVFDGRFLSLPQRVDFQTIVRPTITGVGTTILRELQIVDVDRYFIAVGEGPAFTGFEVMDLNNDSRSARLLLDGNLLAPGIVHSLTTAQFGRLQLRGGLFENRWMDDIVVRAYNGLWTSWTKSTFYTEPEYQNGLQSGVSWLDFIPPAPPPTQITYSFMQNYPGYDSGDASPLNFSRFTNQQRAAVRIIFEEFERFANVDFVEIPDSATNVFGQTGGLIRFGNLFFPQANPPYLAYSYLPSDPTITPTEQHGGDVWVNIAFSSSTNVGFGSVAFATLLKEIAHANGLEDPSAGIPSLPASTANLTFTAMAGTPRPDAINPSNYMLYDVLALQRLYGVNTQFARGDNTYDLPGYWGGRTDLLDMLWDTGGHDVIDVSASLTSSRIDLREGTYSDVGTIRNNLCISFGTLIEDAITGVGNDFLTGNQAINWLKAGAGNDTLTSGASIDTMIGDAGNDTYIWSFGDGNDTINENGGAGRDKIVFGAIPGLNSLPDDFRFSLSGADMLIELRIDGVSEATLRVKNQTQGINRIETLEFNGVRVDFVSLTSQITMPEQRFNLTSNSSAFGFLVAPA